MSQESSRADGAGAGDLRRRARQRRRATRSTSRPLSTDALNKILPSVTSPATTASPSCASPGQDDLARSCSRLASGELPGRDHPEPARARCERGDERVVPAVGAAAADGVSPASSSARCCTVPNAGCYELYLVYDLTDAQQTLGFVQRTLALGGLALVLLIGAVTYLVVRLVVAPDPCRRRRPARSSPPGSSRSASRSSGEDVIATLARSFNGMADSLQQQITRLADLSRVQQRFVSDVSHELRTPLTTIRLAGDVLYDQRDSFPPATARTAELLHTQVERFELLLADLLEISRYDAGAVELELEPTNLVRLVEDVGRVGAAARRRTRLATCGWSRPAGTSTRRWTPAASAASCATCSATRSSTARASRSWSPWTATRRAVAHRRARLRRSAWTRPTSPACSTGSGGPTRRASAPSAAPASGWRSRWRTPPLHGGVARGLVAARARAPASG